MQCVLFGAPPEPRVDRMNQDRRNPEPPSKPGLPYARAWNIAMRTAHIAVASALVGGHVFGASQERLLPWLYAVILTGACLTAIEAFPGAPWLYQARGLFVAFKLLLLGSIPWLWAYRVPILFVVVVVASVGSHMPGRFRYYSILHRRVLNGADPSNSSTATRGGPP